MRRAATLGRSPRRTHCGAAAVAVIAAAAGCSATASPPAPQGSTVFVAPPPVSNYSPPASIGFPILQQPLTEAVTRYSKVYSSLNLNPSQDLSIVDTVAIGQGADSLRSQAKQVADQHLIVGGALKVLRVSVVSVTPNPPVASVPATAIVKSCNDVSSVTGTTPDGKSVVDPKRGPQTQTVLTLTNATPADAATWRVSTVEPSTTPCDPS